MYHTDLGTRRPAAALVTLAAVGLLLAACGGNSSSSDSAPSKSDTSSAAGAAGGGKTVNVDETDYKISLSTSTFTPGTYTFKIADNGQTTHALEIDGPGVSDKASDTVSPGSTTSLTVTLRKGSYELYCPVDGHKDLGMDTTITVG
ncbi:MAG: hypothetical protein ACRDPJ_12100 [Nocardioidaceae bacterium]